MSAIRSEETLDQDLSNRSPVLISDETQWRRRPHQDGGLGWAALAQVAVSRWRSSEEMVREVRVHIPEDCHVVGIALRSVQRRVLVNGRIVRDGFMAPGTLLVTEPGTDVRCVFKGSSDALHLHVPNGLLAECARDIDPTHPASLPSDRLAMRDQAIERLGHALLATDQVGSPFARIYIDSLGIAIVSRLLASTKPDRIGNRPKVSELPRWRLKRVTDYLDEHLGDPVGLADIADVAGLTRMHFAAQFRVATGLRPHEYLLRRRIERSQEMLTGTDMALVEIALAVGFQTQSHFTSVFKKFMGRPPHAWRIAHGAKSMAVSFGKDQCSLESAAL